MHQMSYRFVNLNKIIITGNLQLMASGYAVLSDLSGLVYF